MDPRRRRLPPLRGPWEIGALNFLDTNQMDSWAEPASEKFNLFCSSASVDLDGPALGSESSDPVDQTDPQANQNDTVTQERLQGPKTK